ncbi:MAG: thioredoxin family protein, partial [Flavobacteriaceae bacterium]
TMVEAFKAKHGKLTPEFKEELQHWYNKDKGQTTISDILALLN